MADLNEVRLIGRLTRNPELRTPPGGTQAATFGLATSRKYKQGEEMREETTFVDITCWAKLAELTSTYLHKGSQVYVGGRLRLETWDDKQTSQKRSKLSVVADNIQFLDKKPAAAPQEAEPEATPAWEIPTAPDEVLPF